MKTHYIKTFIFLIFLFGILSCKNEEDSCLQDCSSSEVSIEGKCVDTLCLDSICRVCGTYGGEMDGEISNALGQTENFNNLPILMEVNELSSICSYTVSFDFSSLLNAPTGTLVPEVNGTFSETTISISNQVYVYQEIASITVNGFVNYSSDFNEVNGSLDLTVDAVCTITFVGVRQ